VIAVRRVVRNHRRWLAWGPLIVLVALLVPLAPSVPAAPAGAAAPTPWSVTATPTTSLTDGQRVNIAIKTDASYPIYSAEARVCRSDVTYLPSTASRPNPDFELDGPNCSALPITSSATASSVDGNVFNQAQTELGNQMSIRVGTGTISWPLDAPTTTLTCDADHPCTLVVQLSTNDGWVPWTTPLSYRVDDPIAGCGGPATGVVSSGGSDRISDAWVAWTLAECKEPGRKGAAARASFAGEGPALASYSSGGLDLSFTAAGYDSAVGLLPKTDPPPARPSVAVPLALNATVLAVAGGVRDADSQKLPFQSVKFTLEEAAALIGGGDQGIVPYLPAIVARNPSLGNFYDVSSPVLTGAYADIEATSYFGTHLLSTLRPEAFRVPQLPVFGPDAGKLRGADANLALANPSYAGALSLQTGRPAVTKVINALSDSNSGGVWFLTDLATAQALGMTTVELQNANGDFVAPTAASMAAAVPTMKADANGMLIPDPNAGAPAGEVQPYPLTFVEYGLAPTAPLADAANRCRADSQALLAEWLTYMTTDGQTVLPSGFQPLTAGLKTQAATAIPQVGATAATTPCTTSTTPTTTVDTSAPTDSGGGNFSSDGGGGSSSGNFGSGSSSFSSTPPSGLPAAPGGDTAELAASSAPIPGYGGSSLASGLAAAAAIFAIIILTAVAAKATAGREPGPPAP
jgi:hypothetical protein